MALIKCSNCGGVVSTKAAACPHCETKGFKLAEHKADKIEALADELGSISAAISEEYEQQESLASEDITMQPEPTHGPPAEVISEPRGVFDRIVLSVIWLIIIAMITMFIVFRLEGCTENEQLLPPGEAPKLPDNRQINMGDWRANPSWSLGLDRHAQDYSIDKYMPKPIMPSDNKNSNEASKPQGPPKLLRRP